MGLRNWSRKAFWTRCHLSREGRSLTNLTGNHFRKKGTGELENGQETVNMMVLVDSYLSIITLK